MKISHKVPLLASVIILIGFSVLTFILYQAERTSLYNAATGSASESAQAVADQTVNWLNGKIVLIDMMANYISEEYSVEQIQKVMNNPLLQKEFSLIFGCLDIDGKPISNDSSWNPGEAWDGRIRPWYTKARKAKHAVLTPPYTDSATGRLLLSVVANLQDGSLFKGAFGGDVELSTIAKTVNDINFDDKGYAFLLDKSGTIISHPKTSMNKKPVDTVFPEISVPKTGDFFETPANGRTMLVKFISLHLQERDADWLVAVVLDKDKVMASAEQLKVIAVIATLLNALAASLVLYFLMAHLLLNPMKGLTEAAEQISLGQFNTKVKGIERKDEIGLLAQAVDRMGVSIKLAIERLKKV